MRRIFSRMIDNVFTLRRDNTPSSFGDWKTYETDEPTPSATLQFAGESREDHSSLERPELALISTSGTTIDNIGWKKPETSMLRIRQSTDK